MEVYGQAGAVFSLDRDYLRIRRRKSEPAQDLTAPTPYDDPVGYLAAVVRGQTPEDVLSALSTNMVVVEILEAARLSAKEGRTVYLPK
jgi:predicted dehydrogenase